MPIVPRHPFWGDLERFFEEWPELDWPGGRRRLVPRMPMFRHPRMDIYETDGKIVAEIELPGVNPKNIEIEVKENVLRIEAKREEKKEEKRKGYYRKELSKGYYKRAVRLPAEVVGEKTEATYEEGVLKVVIPKMKPKKKEKEKKKKVKIKTKTA